MELNSTPGDYTAPDAVGECESAEDGGPGEEEVKSWLLAVGTSMVIVASFVSCLGLNLQKLAHNKNEERAAENRVQMHRSFTWLAGMGLMVFGSVLDMAALPFVPMSRVASLGATGMLANIIITPLFLKEKLTTHDVLGGSITAVGTTLACMYGAGSEAKVSSYCVLMYFTEVVFLAYAGCVVVLLAALYYLILGFRAKQAAAVEAGLVIETLECVSAWRDLTLIQFLPIVDTKRHFKFFYTFGPQFYPVVHAVFAGVFGAHSVMFAKVSLTFFLNAMRRSEVLRSVICMFLFLAPTIFCLINQVKYLNVSLKIYCDALFVLPVYQSLWISTGIMTGLIFFKEYESIDSLNMTVFVLGVMISILGLVVLTMRKSSKSALDEEEPAGGSPTVEGEESPIDCARATSHRYDEVYAFNNSFIGPASLAGSFAKLHEEIFEARHHCHATSHGSSEAESHEHAPFKHQARSYSGSPDRVSDRLRTASSFATPTDTPVN